jgi:hypothetical protein
VEEGVLERRESQNHEFRVTGENAHTKVPEEKPKQRAHECIAEPVTSKVHTAEGNYWQNGNEAVRLKHKDR